MIGTLTNTHYQDLGRQVVQLAAAHGCSPSDAEDRAQDVFLHLLRKNAFQFFGGLAEDLAHLRNLVRVAARRFLIDHHRRASALKRGGGWVEDHTPMDAHDPNVALAASAVPIQETPDQALERKEARALIECQIDLLGEQYRAKGWSDRFEAIREFILPGSSPPTYAEVAERLQISHSAVRLIVHRALRTLESMVLDQ